MEGICWHLLFNLGFLSLNLSHLVLCTMISTQNSSFSTFITPPDVTTITLAPNESFTVSYSIRYTEEKKYFLQYKLNGSVIHRQSNYENELNYFTSTYTNCCSQPGEKCHELQLTVNGVDFNHNGIINLVAFDHDTVLQVDSSGDIHIKITAFSSSVLPSSTQAGSLPSPTVTVTKGILNSQRSISAPTVLPLCSPGMVNFTKVPATLAEWPQYLTAGSLLVALTTVTAVLIGTYCLLKKELESKQLAQAPEPPVELKNNTSA